MLCGKMEGTKSRESHSIKCIDCLNNYTTRETICNTELMMRTDNRDEWHAVITQRERVGCGEKSWRWQTTRNSGELRCRPYVSLAQQGNWIELEAIWVLAIASWPVLGPLVFFSFESLCMGALLSLHSSDVFQRELCRWGWRLYKRNVWINGLLISAEIDTAFLTFHWRISQIYVCRVLPLLQLFCIPSFLSMS